MWYLRQLWLASGRTMDQLWSYVIDGMNFTPSFPAYEDMRDGILAAMPTQAEDCIVWDAFAKFGIGVNADGRQSAPFSVTEDFSKPAVCSGAANTAPTVTITRTRQRQLVPAGNSRSPSPGTATDTQDGTITSSLVWTSNIQPGGTIGGGRVVQPLRPGGGNSHHYGVGHRCRRLDRYRDSHDCDYGCSGPDDHADDERFQGQGCSERGSDMDSDRRRHHGCLSRFQRRRQ